MGTFNPKALGDLTKRLKDSQGSSSQARILKQKDIDPDKPVDVRLLKPRANQGGEWNYVVPVVTYWMNKKPYMSNCCLGLENVIAEEIKEAEASGDPTIAELLADDAFSTNNEFYIPIRVIEGVEVDDQSGEVSSVKVNPEKDILVCSPMLSNAIHDIVCNPKYIAGRNGNGIFDAIKGNSITLSKKVKNGNTSYTAAIAEQFAMPEAYVKPEKTPDIIAHLKKNAKSQEYLRCAIRNYLYGEDMPEKDEWADELKDQLSHISGGTEESTDTNEEATTQTQKPVAKATPKPVTKPAGGKNLADRLAGLDDE